MQQDQKLKALQQRMQNVLGTYANNSRVMKQTIIAQSVEIERLRQLLQENGIPYTTQTDDKVPKTIMEESDRPS